MNNDNALVLSQNRELTPAVWGMLKEMAPVMHVSRLFGVSSPEQATAIMLKGYELGLSVTASFEFVHVIEGKPSLSPRGALAILMAKGALDDFKLTDIMKDGKLFGVRCYMKRGNIEYTVEFTRDDAEKAGLIEGSPTANGKRAKGNYEKYERQMYTWRAVGYCADIIAPDLTGGLSTYMKMPEAFTSIEVDDNGDFVKPGMTIIDAPKAIESPKVPVITLNDLIAQYSPEAIMEANGGKIPGTDAEIVAVTEKLATGTK